MSKKTTLTPLENVQCYIANRHRGIDQKAIADLYSVSNSARGNEAVQGTEWAANNILEAYRLALAAKVEKQG